MTVQNVSLPEELQKVLDQKIGMGMVVGQNMGQFVQYQAAQALPTILPHQDRAVAWQVTPLGWGPAWLWGKSWPNRFSRGCRGAQAATGGIGVRPLMRVMATIEVG